MFNSRIRHIRRRVVTISILLLFVARLDATLSFQLQCIGKSKTTRTLEQRRYPYRSCQFSIANEGHDQDGKEKNEKPDIPDFNLLDRSCPDFEQRPSRRMKKKKGEKRELSERTNAPRYPTLESKFKEWGVETIDDPSQQPKCPCTINSVAQAAFHAISSTLYHQNRLDPNIANNAIAVSVTDKRPLAFAYWPEGRDVGRLGIEIDGARFLRHKKEGRAENVMNDGRYRSLTPTDRERMSLSMKKRSYYEVEQEGRALRRLSLVLASKLSSSPWEGLEHYHIEMESELDSSEKKTRPVALFFNTIRQALLASQELQLLQQKAENCNEDVNYENVRILCLGQDEIPLGMTEAGKMDVKGGKKQRKRGSASALSKGTVNPHNGLVLVVQPTDFNNESKIPSPSIGTIHHLQRLLARASIAQIPSIVISPRLTEQLSGSGIEQSGYQQSSTYGGVEPPKGPTPWILRDFATPVFSWIGNALEIARRPPSLHSMENEYVSRVTITQSVMDSGHPWHFFTVEENLQCSESRYRYIASTGTRSGRPSRQIISDVISEWC